MYSWIHGSIKVKSRIRIRIKWSRSATVSYSQAWHATFALQEMLQNMQSYTVPQSCFQAKCLLLAVCITQTK
jgi:hypothetical protein